MSLGGAIRNRRLWVGALVLGLAALAAWLVAAPSAALVPAKVAQTERLPAPGGSWTPKRTSRDLLRPASHLSVSEQLEFYTGMTLFRAPWVAAPSSTRARDGLGPLFNSRSCLGCHPGGGRGESLLTAPESLATVARISRHGAPHPEWGNQVQPFATFRGADGGADDAARPGRGAAGFGEGRLALDGSPQAAYVRGPRADRRQQRLLQRPKAQILDAAGQPVALHPDDRVSVRAAPALFGMGLLEELDEAAILAGADPGDENGDGVSGRPHWLGAGRLGRFGWKATRVSVTEQTAAALSEDIGITTSWFPEASCAPGQIACQQQPNGGNSLGAPEIPDDLLATMVSFVRHIPPPLAGRDTAAVRRGEQRFAEAGCAACHTPSFESTAGTIWPYSDLLLHDMGPDLADGRRDGDASGREWRTPPLWGLGTQSGKGLLHDARARNLTEAVLWHGGEASASRERFSALAPAARQDLLRFVRAL
ncbi:MAG: di-heme oxidoredictase family protein [Pseudomonadota bacterium]